MPTTPAKARHLLNQKKAKVAAKAPFTIQMLHGSSGYKQGITLGVDAGYSTIGYSAVTRNRELIAGEVKLRKDIKRLIEKKRNYRRMRRNRLWYRQPRFLNRATNKKEGWLAPSIKHKLDSHLKLIYQLKRIVPITKTVVEVATFDTQKMQNPEISGVEYQQGKLQGYEIREYLLKKWKHKCAYCGKRNIPLEIEHITPKSKGGGNRVSNLTLACHDCNQAKGNKTAKEFGYPKLQAKAGKSLKAATFMNFVRSRIVDKLKCEHTYGYITKYNRIKLRLEKSHINDAFVIANGNNQIRASRLFIAKQVRRQNRSLFKAKLLKGGRLKRNTVKEVNNFRRYDKVKYAGKACFIYGLRRRGYFDLRLIDGSKVGASVSSKKLMKLESARGKIQEVKLAQSLTAAKSAVFFCSI